MSLWSPGLMFFAGILSKEQISKKAQEKMTSGDFEHKVVILKCWWVIGVAQKVLMYEFGKPRPVFHKSFSNVNDPDHREHKTFDRL